jgi:uncharacterized protein DUF4272
VTPPLADEVADRALVLYALVRRAAIELALGEFGDDPHRVAQAEAARAESDAWLDREGIAGAATEAEGALLEARSGAWPREAIVDGMWRKEALAALLWALRHMDGPPAVDEEAEAPVLNERIERYGSVSSFRANGRLREEGEIDRAFHEADTWLGVTEGRSGNDATIASISAERRRALGWLRDRDAAPA